MTSGCNQFLFDSAIFWCLLFVCYSWSTSISRLVTNININTNMVYFLSVSLCTTTVASPLNVGTSHLTCLCQGSVVFAIKNQRWCLIYRFSHYGLLHSITVTLIAHSHTPHMASHLFLLLFCSFLVLLQGTPLRSSGVVMETMWVYAFPWH